MVFGYIRDESTKLILKTETRRLFRKNIAQLINISNKIRITGVLNTKIIIFKTSLNTTSLQ